MATRTNVTESLPGTEPGSSVDSLLRGLAFVIAAFGLMIVVRVASAGIL